MELAQVLTNLREISDYFKNSKPDSVRPSKIYCDKLSKFLKTILGLRDTSYDDYIFVLWVVLDQFGQFFDRIQNGSHRDKFCQNLFIVCAKAVLGIQWQKLDDDSECKLNFRSTVELIHSKMVVNDFHQFAQVVALMDTHWSDPILTQVMSGSEECEEEEATKYIMGEAPIVLTLRVDMLVEENCEEFALNLCNKCVAHPKLKLDLELREKQLLLMQKLNNFEELQEQCQTMSCDLAVEILKKWETKRSRKKFLVRLLQLFVVQEWLRPPQENKFKDLISMWIRQQFLSDGDKETFQESVWAIAKMSYRIQDTSRIHLLLEGLALVCGDIFLQLCTDISIYAINLDKKFLEMAEADANTSEIILRKKAMSVTCRIISALFEKKNLKLCRFSALTSFSLFPSNETMFVVEKMFSNGDPLKPEPKNLASMYDGSKTSPCKCLLTSLKCFCAKDKEPVSTASKHIELMLPSERSEIKTSEIKDFSNEFLKFLQTKDEPEAKEEEVDVEDVETDSKKDCNINSVNDIDTKIDPAMLYELERQLDMNRSPTLSPYLAWVQLRTVCRDHINQFGMIDRNVGLDWFEKKAMKDAATTCVPDIAAEKETTQKEASYFMNSDNAGKKNEFGQDLVTNMMNNLSTDTGSRHVKRSVASFFPSRHQAERDNNAVPHENVKSAAERSRFSELHKYSSLLQQSLKSPLESISSGQLLSLSKIQKSPPRSTNSGSHPVSPKGHVAHGFPFVSFQKIQNKAQSHHILPNSDSTMTVGKLLSATAKKSAETVGKTYGSEKAIDPNIRQLDTPDIPTKVPHLLLGKLQSPSKINGKPKQMSRPNSFVKTSLNVTNSDAELRKESVMSDHDYRHHIIQPTKSSKVSMKRHATKVCKNIPEVIMKRLESLSDSNQPHHIAVPYPDNMDPRLIPPGWYKVRLVNGQNVLLKGYANLANNHEKKPSQPANKLKQTVPMQEENSTVNNSSQMYVASIIDSVRAAQQSGPPVSKKGKMKVATTKASSHSSQPSVRNTVASTGHMVANSTPATTMPFSTHIRSSLVTTSSSAVSAASSYTMPTNEGGQLPSIFTIFQRPTSTVGGSVPSAQNATTKSDISKASLVSKVHSLIHGSKCFSGIDDSLLKVTAENRPQVQQTHGGHNMPSISSAMFKTVEDRLTNTVKSMIISSSKAPSAPALDTLAAAAVIQERQGGPGLSTSLNVQVSSTPLHISAHQVSTANLEHPVCPVSELNNGHSSNQSHSISSAHSSTCIQKVPDSDSSTGYSTYQILLSPKSKLALKQLQAGVKSSLNTDIPVTSAAVTVSESNVITTSTSTVTNSVKSTELLTSFSETQCNENSHSPKFVKKLLHKAAMYRLKAKGVTPEKVQEDSLILLKYQDVSQSGVESAEHEHFQKTKLPSYQSVFGSETGKDKNNMAATEERSIEAKTVSSVNLLDNSGRRKTVKTSQMKTFIKQVPGVDSSNPATSAEMVNVINPLQGTLFSSKQPKIVNLPFDPSTLTSPSPVRIKAKPTKLSEPSQGQKMALAAVDAVQNQQALYGALPKGETKILPKLVKIGKPEKPIYPLNQPQYVTSVGMNPTIQTMPNFVPNISISQPSQMQVNALNFPIMDQGFLSGQNIPLTGVVHNVSDMSQVASSLPPASIDMLNQNFDSSMYVIMDVTNSQGSQPLTTIVLHDANGGLLQNQVPLNSYLLESLQMQPHQSLHVLQPPIATPVQSKPIDLSLGVLPMPPLTMTVMPPESSGEVTPTNSSDVVHSVAQLSEVTLGSTMMPFNMPILGLSAMSSLIDSSMQMPQNVGNFGALSMQAFGTLPQAIYSNGVNNPYGIAQMPPVFCQPDIPLNIAQTLMNSNPNIPFVVPLPSEATALSDISLNAAATDVGKVVDMEPSLDLDDKQDSSTPDISETFGDNVEDANSIDNLVSELSTLPGDNNFDTVNDPESVMLPEDQHSPNADINSREENSSIQKSIDMKHNDVDSEESTVPDEECLSGKNVADDSAHIKETANKDDETNTKTNANSADVDEEEAMVKEVVQSLVSNHLLLEDIDRSGALTQEITQDKLSADKMSAISSSEYALNSHSVDDNSTLLPEKSYVTDINTNELTVDRGPEYCVDSAPTEVKYGMTEEFDRMKEPTKGEVVDPESVSTVEENSNIIKEDIPVNMEGIIVNVQSASVSDHNLSESIAMDSLEHTKIEQSCEGIGPHTEAKTVENDKMDVKPSDGISPHTEVRTLERETIVEGSEEPSNLDPKQRNVSPQFLDNPGQNKELMISHDKTEEGKSGIKKNDMPRVVEDTVPDDEENLEPAPEERRIQEAISNGQVTSAAIQSICTENNLQEVTLNLQPLEEISDRLSPVNAKCYWNDLEKIETVASIEAIVLKLELENTSMKSQNEERTSPDSEQTFVEAVNHYDEDEGITDEQVLPEMDDVPTTRTVTAADEGKPENGGSSTENNAQLLTTDCDGKSEVKAIEHNAKCLDNTLNDAQISDVIDSAMADGEALDCSCRNVLNVHKENVSVQDDLTEDSKDEATSEQDEAAVPGMKEDDLNVQEGNVSAQDDLAEESKDEATSEQDEAAVPGMKEDDLNVHKGNVVSAQDDLAEESKDEATSEQDEAAVPGMKEDDLNVHEGNVSAQDDLAEDSKDEATSEQDEAAVPGMKEDDLNVHKGNVVSAQDDLAEDSKNEVISEQNEIAVPDMKEDDLNIVLAQEDLAKDSKYEANSEQNEDAVTGLKEADDSNKESMADHSEFIPCNDDKSEPVDDNDDLSASGNVCRSAIINSEETQEKTPKASANNCDDHNDNSTVPFPVIRNPIEADLVAVCKYIVDKKLENTFACQEKRLQQSSFNNNSENTDKIECLSADNDSSCLAVPNASSEYTHTWSSYEKPIRDHFTFENDTELSSRSITPVSSNSRNGSPVSWTCYTAPINKILKCSIKKSVNFANINLKKYFATCYRCAICNMIFRKLHLLRNHIRSICKSDDLPRFGSKDPPSSKEDPSYCYTCLRCRGTIKAKPEILHHLQFCYNVDPYEIESKESAVNLTPQKTFRCPACNKSMNQEELLTTHPEVCRERPKLHLKEKTSVPVFQSYLSEDSDCSEAIRAENDANGQRPESDVESLKKSSRSQTPVVGETTNLVDEDVENRTEGIFDGPVEDLTPLNEQEHEHDSANEEHVNNKNHKSCKVSKKKGDIELKRLIFEGKMLLTNQLRRGRQTRRSLPEGFFNSTVKRHSRSSSSNTTQSSDTRASRAESTLRKSLGQPHSTLSSREPSPTGSFGISLERRTRSSSGSVSSVVTDNASGNSVVDNFWKIKCSKCGFIYPNTQSLVQHMASTHLKPFKYNTFKKFPFECIYCERCFMTYFNYMNHVSQHTEIILSANQGIKCHKKTQRISMSKCQAELIASNPEIVAGNIEGVDNKHEEGIKTSDAIKRKYASMKEHTRDIAMNTQQEENTETTADSEGENNAESSVMNLRYKRVYPVKQTIENVSKSDAESNANSVNSDSASDNVSICAKKQKTADSSMVEKASPQNTHVLRSTRGNRVKNDLVSNVNENIVTDSSNTRTYLTSQGHEDSSVNAENLNMNKCENSKIRNNKKTKNTNETIPSSDESSPLKRRCLDNRAFRELRRRAASQPFVWDLGDSHEKKQPKSQSRLKDRSPPPCRSPDRISTRSNRLSLPASSTSLDVIHERRKVSTPVVKTADKVTSASTQCSPTDVAVGKSKWKVEHMHKKGRMRIKYRRT